jgi:D-glycero-alpha-D-manno-heptose-7-phosphate kinase
VGLVNSVYAMRNVHPEQYELAAEACKIEIKYCHKPIGRQDQYATALGGLRELTFKPGNDLVGTYLVPQQGDVPRLLRNQMLLFDTGIGRDGDAILAAECQSIGDHTATLLAMAQMARDAGEILGRGRIDELGPMLDEAWQMKKSLAVGISNPQIDTWYAAGKAAGATGGKVLGAGGGGFMLFLASPNRHEQIVAALPELHHVAFDWDYTGTTVVFSDIPG